MMKYLFLTLALLLFINYSDAQYQFSSKNKKAIKLFQKACSAPMDNLNPNTNIPDYKLGIELVNKAIKKDSNFWEAHLLAAELTEKISDLEKAIFHYKKALSIDPYHSRSSKTNFFLALCEFNTGKYEDANKNMNIFINNPNAIK